MTFSNTETNNKLGLALMSPSTQTILPVVTDNGNLQGFFSIASTTFAGTETSFPLAEGPVALTTVTLPQKVYDGHHIGVQQYMAVAYDDPKARAWLGYSAFVGVNDTGYGMQHLMPSQGWFTRFNRGVLITNLQVNMAADSPAVPSSTQPTAQNGAIRWVASMNVNSTQLEGGFFDFPWIDLFKAKSSATAMRIEIVSNPIGGAFKSTLVPNPAITPLGGVEFNTVRIIRLQEAVAGSYVFTYKVYDDQNQSTTCTLTLTLV